MASTTENRDRSVQAESTAVPGTSAWQPLSSAQQGLWFAYRLHPCTQGDYNIGLTMRMRPAITSTRLQGALDALAQRHPMLRARFADVDAVPQQTIHDDATVPLRVVNAVGIDDTALATLANAERRRAIDISTDPPLAATLYEQGEHTCIICLTFDHIASDGWSLFQLTEELGELIAGAGDNDTRDHTTGCVMDLTSVPVVDGTASSQTSSYTEYVAHERAWLDGKRANKQLDFWERTLGETSSGAALLPDFRSPQGQDARSASPESTGATTHVALEVLLPGDLTAALRAFATQEGTTLFVIMLAAYTLLLQRLTGQEQLSIGSVMPTRGDRWKRTAGNFVNSVVMPSQILPGMTVAELLKRTEALAFRTLKNKDYPTRELAARLKARAPGLAPRADTFYLFQKARHAQDMQAIIASCKALGPVPWGGFEVEAFGDYFHSGTMGQALTLGTLDLGPVICSSWGYDTRVFERQTIERFAQRWMMLLRAMIADVQQRVDQLPWLDDEERRRVVEDFATATVQPIPDSDSIPAFVHERFARHAARDPGALAVQYGTQTLSYSELNAQANQLARHLRSLGVGPEARVGVCMARSSELIVALLATWKAGGAYLPLDPAYPLERLTHMLEDSTPTLVITHAAARDVATRLSGAHNIVDMQADAPLWAATSSADISAKELGLAPHHLAYVIYTSGSTGRPKGAMNEHRGLSNLFAAQAKLFGVEAGHRVLQFASPSFDASVSEAVLALGTGASLHLAARTDLLPGRPLLETMRQAQITHVTLPPSALSACDVPGVPFVPSTVIVAGEAVSASEANKWSARLTLFNAYGPSEAAVCSTAHRCTPGERIVPIGRAIANTRIYILDVNHQPSPIGVTGEIYVGGAGVGRGYLNRPELTAERFSQDPFCKDGGRLYRTGDLGRWLTNGEIEYLGRNDGQVKVRGFRIELAEVEARLSALEGASDVVVIAREDVPGEKRLVAYYCGAPQLTTDALRKHATTTLPEFMVPAAYVRMEAFPVTPNGKVDRKALPAPEQNAFVSRGYEAPLDTTERTIAELWSSLLKQARVGRHDNFFELGGNSLLAVTFLERMRTAGLHLQAAVLFSEPHLAALALRVERQDNAIAAPANLIVPTAQRITPEMLPLVTLSQSSLDKLAARIPGGAANIQDIYPLAPLQEGILFHHLSNPEGDTYLIPALLTFEHRAQLDEFASVLQTIIDRHDILRTAIAWRDLDEPVQVVQRHVAFPVQDIACPAGDSRDDVVAQLKALYDPRRVRIDLQQAPLLRGFASFDAPRSRWMLVLLMHHMVGDHTSLQLLMREAAEIAQGRGAQLPAAVPYRNFVAQARLSSSRHADERFFETLLGDVEEPTAPFGLLATTTVAAPVEARRLLTVDRSHDVRERAQALGVSAASFMHLAWALVLARTSGRSDVVFGTVLLGRLHAGAQAEQIMGMFINTLPARINLEGRSVLRSLEDTQALLVHLLEHEQTPLTVAQGASAVPAQTPLLSALFNYRHAVPESDVALPFELLWGEGFTNYPLCMSVQDSGQQFALTAQVIGDVAPDRVCAMMEQSVGNLLHALTHAPDSQVLAVEVLPAVERQQVLQTWNDTRADYRLDRCVHELIEDQVARTPQAVAVVYADTALSYSELNEHANRLARHLRTMGVGPDVTVTVCLERSIELVIALLATLKAGGAYVPIDPAHPKLRLQHMLQDSASAVVLMHHATRELIADVAPTSLARVDLDADAASWTQYSSDNLSPADIGLTAEHLAYIIYTSGSTGQPKGAMNEHRGVVNRMMWMHQTYGIGPADTVLQKTPFSFDVSVWEFFCTLLAGARLIMAKPGGHRDPTYLSEVIAQHRVSTLHFVPSMLQQFLTQEPPSPLSSLERVFCSGEALSAATVRRFHELFTGVELHNLYGPTEAAVDVTAWQCHVQDERASIPIGSPVANTQMYVLDQRMQPAPVGVAGEIYIGGVQVGRGYLNRAELTEERFVRDPFSDHARARLYKTGDLGRWLPEGALEYLGRNDFQVKVRGFRIELSEIEARLATLGGVSSVIVMAREDEQRDKLLVAYYTAVAPLAADALRQHAGGTLPEYMVPSAYVWVEAWPLTANGKIDRKRLPAPQSEAFGSRATYEAPRGELECMLAAIWSDVLQRRSHGELHSPAADSGISRHDNFFQLGGHSLSALRVIERMRQNGIHADVRCLFEHPVLAELATAVANASAAPSVPDNLIPLGAQRITPDMLPLATLSQAAVDQIVERIPGGALNVQDIYPLTPLQQGMWFHHLLQNEGDTYIMHSTLSFRERSEVDSFTAALQAVVDRHDILRTSIAWEGLDEPVQVVQRTATFRVDTMTCDPEQGDCAEQMRRRYDPGHYRFDLHQAPLLRGVVAYDARHARWLLLFLVHHLVDDQTTLKSLVLETQAIRRGAGAQLPPPVPFRNFVAQARLSSNVQEHEAFFQTMLGDYDEPTLPFGLASVSHEGADFKQLQRCLPLPLAAALRAQARKLQLTSASIMHLAWALVLARSSGRNDVVFGTVLSGRTRGGAHSEHAFGMFINTLPVRLRLEEHSVASSLRELHTLLAALMQHEQAPLVLAQRCSALPAQTPLLSAFINCRQAASASGQRIEDMLEGVEVLAYEERSHFPLGLAVDDLGDEGFQLIAQATADHTPERMLAMMEHTLAQVVAALEQAPDSPVLDIDVLPSAERERVMVEWNANAGETAPQTTLQAAIEARVQQTPHALAVVSGTNRLSYSQLNTQANQLAHYLRRLGVRPNTFVAVCAEPGAEFVVATLAVFKAGGVWLPLDPRSSAAELAYMLSNSSPLTTLVDSHGESLLARLDLGRSRVNIESDSELWGRESIRDLSEVSAGVQSCDLAYALYTSGTTGQPKAALHEQRDLSERVRSQAATFGIGQSSRLLLSASAGLLSNLSEIGMALSTGATLCCAPRAAQSPGRVLVQTMAKYRVSHVTLTPSALAACDDVVLPFTANTVIVTGDILHSDLAQRWSRRVALFNAYSASEAGVSATVHHCVAGASRVLVGRPVGNTQIYILDERQRPVPVGVVGEIYIGGSGIARGYLDDAAASEHAFIDSIDSIPTDARGQLFRTGDIGRWSSDGSVEYVGRNDFASTHHLHSERAEIEAQLSTLTGVTAVMVTTQADKKGKARWLAYYYGKHAPDASTLRDRAVQVLPAFRVPARLLRLEALPLTMQGKLDGKHLAKTSDSPTVRDESRAASGSDVLARAATAKNATERVLFKLYREVLGVSHVDAQSHFFELGGHSLLVPKLAQRLSEELGREVPLRVIFERPQIAALAHHLRNDAPTTQIVALQRRARTARTRALPPVRTTNAQRVLPIHASAHAGAHPLLELLRPPARERLYDAQATGRIVSALGQLHQAALGANGHVVPKLAREPRTTSVLYVSMPSALDAPLTTAGGQPTRAAPVGRMLLIAKDLAARQSALTG